jgi:nucleotide-binding universal stress UspA family protein
MKTILAPTDFSAPALNAIYYGAEIARLTGAKLVLLHAYQIPIVASEIPVVIPGFDELEIDGLEQLGKIKADLEQVFGSNLTIELVCRAGFAVDVIKDYCQANTVSFIVMGIQGAGHLEERLIGSITTSLMRHSKTPVLGIAQSVKFKAVKRIVLASDGEGFENPRLLAPMKELARLFNAHIYVLHIVEENEALTATTKTLVKNKLAELLHSFQHSFHTKYQVDVLRGITDFVAEKNAGMIVMIPKKTSFQSLFSHSKSKKVAFQTDVPLLTIHE